jgi:hypothetical protein
VLAFCVSGVPDFRFCIRVAGAELKRTRWSWNVLREGWYTCSLVRILFHMISDRYRATVAWPKTVSSVTKFTHIHRSNYHCMLSHECARLLAKMKRENERKHLLPSIPHCWSLGKCDYEGNHNFLMINKKGQREQGIEGSTTGSSCVLLAICSTSRNCYLNLLSH